MASAAKLFKISGREDYFAVNDKPMGLSTSYRVSGRLGEMARRFFGFTAADKHCRDLNRAYRLGYKHGIDVALSEEALANAEREGMKRAAEMRELVISFVKDEIDVMTHNYLGDPEKQHNVKWARKLGITPEETAILSEAGEG